MEAEQIVNQGSSTINRALRILAEIGGSTNGVTVIELARRCDVNRVTVHRIIAAFKAHGFVRQPTPGGPYRLGFRFLELADLVLSDTDAARLAAPLLATLAERSGETSHFALLDGSEAVYVAKRESSQAVRLVSTIGARVPLYCTGLGKALLAAASPELARRLIAEQSFVRVTPTTLTSAAGLRKELDTIRARGYAVDLGENEVSVNCVSAAVLGRDGEPIGAISISGPAWRIDKGRFAELGGLVEKTSAALSNAIVGRPIPAAAQD